MKWYKKQTGIVRLFLFSSGIENNYLIFFFNDFVIADGLVDYAGKNV